jgi:hypothetical protein
MKWGNGEPELESESKSERVQRKEKVAWVVRFRLVRAPGASHLIDRHRLLAVQATRR